MLIKNAIRLGHALLALEQMTEGGGSPMRNIFDESTKFLRSKSKGEVDR